MGTSIFLYASSSTSAVEQAEIKSRLFDPLAQVEQSALFATIDDSKDSHLHKLIWFLGEGRWQGLLVLAFPQSVVRDSDFAEMGRPSFQWLISARKRTLDASQFVREPLVSTMALALKVCERAGTVVVLLGDGAGSSNRAIIVSTEAEHRLFTVAETAVCREFYQTLRTQSDYGFASPRITALSQFGISRAPLPPNDGHNFVPHAVYSSWAQQEFHNDETAEAFFRMLRDAYPELHSTLKPPLSLLPAPHQTALGALRVCRRMSTWTLEGSPFECSVMLVENEQKAGAHSIQFPPAFSLGPKIPFAFPYLGAIRKAAEMVHASDLLMMVGLDNGELFQLSAVVKDRLNSRSRHELFPQWTGEKNAQFILIHCRHGFVEVYASGKLHLWYDGFRWLVQPYDVLEDVLRQFFGPNNDQVVSRYRAAIASILDLQESSILVLAHRDDMATFESCAKPRMREGIEPSPSARANFSQSGMSIDTIIGVLHLDGAHCVDDRGELRAWARQIIVSPSNEKTVDPGLLMSGQGAGARSAQWLSQQMPSSFVIKTSASGFIKIFHKGRPQFKPKAI